MAKQAQELVKDLGFENSVNGREYVITSNGGKFRFVLARAKDIPTYVEAGVADLGITGKDLVEEQGRKVTEVLALPFGFCRLVYAIPRNYSGNPKKVATAFPRLAERFLRKKGIQAEIVWLGGAVEASVAAGIADAIVDLTSSGKTLETNGLQVAEEIMRSGAVVIANPGALDAKRQELNEAIKALAGELSLFKASLSELNEGERKRLVCRNADCSEQARQTAKEVFDRVTKERDEAVAYYVEKFDGLRLEPEDFEVTQEEIKAAYSQVGEELTAALRKSAENISRFSRKELPESWEVAVTGGAMGKKIVPLERVGVYAPGGTAAYPSSVLMGVVPAKVAGVKEVVLCTPCNRQGACNPAVLVAADISGASRVFKLGGAQAIAAMALGTRTVPKVTKIVGPGNAFVAAAKVEAQARGLVSIDSPAGPSESIVIADGTAKPAFAAAELLAQAEHGPDAAAVLVATSKEFIDRVEKEMKEQLRLLPRRQVIRKALASNGALLLAKDVDEAMAFAEEYAPEHLMLMVEEPDALLGKARNSGAVFAGSYSSVVAGDYCAGPNHVLPTGGTAKMYSGLSARDFVKEVNYLALEKQGLACLADGITTLAEAEGLTAHAEAIRKRFERDEDDQGT